MSVKTKVTVPAGRSGTTRSYVSRRASAEEPRLERGGEIPRPVGDVRDDRVRDLGAGSVEREERDADVRSDEDDAVVLRPQPEPEPVPPRAARVSRYDAARARHLGDPLLRHDPARFERSPEG